VVLLPALVFGS
jgi:hypothetical protein